MTATPLTPQHIAANLVDPLAYSETHSLHADFTWLRANLPVSKAEVAGFEPFWVVTKHADIAEISRQNALFHNGDRPTVLTDRASEALVRKLTGMPHLVRSLVQMDAPDHPKYRVLTQQWFTNQSVRKLEMRILFEELIPKLKSVELTGAPRRSASTFVGGPKTLPLRFTLNYPSAC